MIFKNFLYAFILKRMSSPDTTQNMPTMLPFNNAPIIGHEIAKDLLGLTMLVYDYSNKFTLDNDETIESFVNENESVTSDVELNVDVTDERKEVLENLSKTSPHGRVVKFISDPTTDIQVGITISETNKRITVVFRGSESKSDWYYDLMILKTKILEEKYRNCSVHSGFYRQLHETDVYEQILETLKPLKEKGIGVCGVEPAKNVADLAEKDGVSTIVGYFEDESTISQISQKADLVTAFNVFAHSDKLTEITQNAFKILKNDGFKIVAAFVARMRTSNGEAPQWGFTV